MLQLVMIAMSLMCLPDVLIADEPTTALDVTIQAQILELLAEIQAEMGLAVILVTHNMGVVAEICDRVAVMYNGEIVEKADAASLFAPPRPPYTDALLRSTLMIAGTRGHFPLTTPRPRQLCARLPCLSVRLRHYASADSPD